MALDSFEIVMKSSSSYDFYYLKLDLDEVLAVYFFFDFFSLDGNYRWDILRFNDHYFGS